MNTTIQFVAGLPFIAIGVYALVRGFDADVVTPLVMLFTLLVMLGVVRRQRPASQRQTLRR